MSYRCAIQIDPADLAYLDATALRLDCSRHRLVAAMIHCIARDDMADAILDGESPTEIRPHRRPAGKGRPRPGRPRGSAVQDAVLAAIAAHRSADGLSVVSGRAIAAAVGCSQADVSGAVKRLIRDLRVERIAAYDRVAQRPAVYRVPQGAQA